MALHRQNGELQVRFRNKSLFKALQFVLKRKWRIWKRFFFRVEIFWFKQYFIQHFSHIHSIILYGTGFDKKLRAYVNHLLKVI